MNFPPVQIKLAVTCDTNSPSHMVTAGAANRENITLLCHNVTVITHVGCTSACVSRCNGHPVYIREPKSEYTHLPAAPPYHPQRTPSAEDASASSGYLEAAGFWRTLCCSQGHLSWEEEH